MTTPPTEEGLGKTEAREINERTNENSDDDADNQYRKVGGVIGYWFFIYFIGKTLIFVWDNQRGRRTTLGSKRLEFFPRRCD